MSVHFFQQLVNGLSVGMVYALMAIGFTLIFGILNVVNFAHGEIFTIGGFAGLMAIMLFAPPLSIVVLIVLAIGVLAGFGLERLGFKPFRRFHDEASLKSRAMRESTLLSSLALSIIIREVIHHLFGAEMQTIPQDYLLQKPIFLGPITLASGQLVILGTSLGMIAVLQYMLYHTRIGLSIRAISNNPLGAKHCGLRVDRSILATFGIGSMFGAAGGILVGLYYGAIFPHMGFNPLVKAFVAMVMGGLSSIPGAVICALILGVCESVGTEFVPAGWTDLIGYSFLLITLIFFPRGIFGGAPERF
jgi:branched-chain amino acid transport system permease protein